MLSLWPHNERNNGLVYRTPKLGRCLDITGRRFGRLVVHEFVGTRGMMGAVWSCLCDCGNTVTVLAGNIKKENGTVSCGCYQKQRVRETSTKHGYAAAGTSEYRAYKSARLRCNNPRHHAYANYGGRGIKFLFNSFPEFLNAVGHKPIGDYSIDRINNEGHYGPGNVRWATRSEQAQNRRRRSCKRAA